MANKFIFYLVIACFSCGRNVEQDENKKKKEFEITKSIAIKEAVIKYGVKYLLDTLEFENSIDYKPVILSKYQIIDKFKVADIYEKDSVEYASVIVGRYSSFFIDFPITKEQGNQLTNMEYDNILVISLINLKKIKLEFGLLEEEESSQFYLDYSTDFIGKAKIIEILNLKKNNSSIKYP